MNGGSPFDSVDLQKGAIMPRAIDRYQLRQLLDSGAQLIEVLAADEYAEEHLPGAVNIPLKQLGAQTAALLDASKPVAVYCWDAL
jgi:rhodanese-related sulfurtransferase